VRLAHFHRSGYLGPMYLEDWNDLPLAMAPRWPFIPPQLWVDDLREAGESESWGAVMPR
jgi:hypothetical protein